MKQTKPYGRAFHPAGSEAAAPPKKQFVEEKRSPVAAQRPSKDDPDTVIRDYPAVPIQPPRKLSKLARFSINMAVAIVVVISYVGLRDSLFVQNLISMLTNKETVMVCLNGEMRYDGWSVWDRLQGNGRFTCTDWKVQNRFVSLPRF